MVKLGITPNFDDSQRVSPFFDEFVSPFYVKTPIDGFDNPFRNKILITDFLSPFFKKIFFVGRLIFNRNNNKKLKRQLNLFNVNFLKQMYIFFLIITIFIYLALPMLRFTYISLQP